MMEIIKDIPQGSDEWMKMRIGSIGGSSISPAVAKGEGKMRKSLLYTMVGEMLSGQKKETFKSKEMENGLTFEDDGRTLYSFMTDTEVEQIAMFRDGPNKHASPDGVVGDDGLIEIKTVIPSTFVEYKNTGVIPTDYRRQIQWTLHISGRKWCDYVVHCPAIKEIAAVVITRVWRDEKEIYILNDGADMFIEEMLEMYKKITGNIAEVAK